MILLYAVTDVLTGFSAYCTCILTPEQQTRCQEIQNSIDALIRSTLPETTILMHDKSQLHIHYDIYTNSYSAFADYHYQLKHPDELLCSYVVNCGSDIGNVIHAYYMGEIDIFPKLTYIVNPDNTLRILIAPEDPNFDFFIKQTSDTTSLQSMFHVLYSENKYPPS